LGNRVRARDRSLCLPTCWDDAYLVELEGRGIHRKVHELYGSLASSIIGSGRASFVLPAVSMEQAKRHIEKAHRLGMKFDYLLNAACLGNREFDNEGQKRILSLLEWLSECEVDTVTVSTPYLVDVIRRYFPGLAINVSTIAHVDSVPKARFWEGMGVERITLDFMMNRDFEFLKAVGSAVQCGLEVIVHDLCLYGCPFRYYHYNTMAHASQEGDDASAVKHQLAASYPLLRCNLIRLTDSSEILKIRWIRPEDVGCYRDLGVSFFKLVERARPMSELLLYAQAYADESYSGNLLDIMPILPAGMTEAGSSNRDMPIYVDNSKLDGFLDYFKTHNCRTQCHECSYCRGVAEEAVTVVDQKQLDDHVRFLREKLNSITDWGAVINDTCRATS
jgi:collagenase-like PrtC family protease